MPPKMKAVRRRRKRQRAQRKPDPDKLPALAELTCLKQVRYALACLDVIFPHSVNGRNGEWSSFDIGTLKNMYDSRRKHMLAEPETKLWWEGIRPSTDTRACAKHAIFFWFNVDGSPSLPYAIAQGPRGLGSVDLGLGSVELGFGSAWGFVRLIYICMYVHSSLVCPEPKSIYLGSTSVDSGPGAVDLGPGSVDPGLGSVDLSLGLVGLGFGGEGGRAQVTWSRNAKRLSYA